MNSLSTETSENIISVWLHGEHLEDAKLMPASLFLSPYDAIAKDIRSGSNLAKLMKRHGMPIINQLLTNYYPALYQQSVQELLKEQMYRGLPENATPQELLEHAAKYVRQWAQPPQRVDLTEGYVETMAKRREQKPIYTGIATVDEYTHGIYPGQLTIVGARPSVGKSAFCLQVAFDVAQKGNKVLFLPLEMSAAETVDRIVMRYSKNGLAYADLRRGSLEGEKWDSANETMDIIYRLRDNFIVYENVREIDAIEELVSRENPDLIVIDQLSQIRSGNEYKTLREQYVEVTRRLKAMALKEDVAVWLPCQMNRESSKTGAVSIDYLKESGSIEEDADIVLILSNKKDEEGNYVVNMDGREVTLEIAKNRQGRCGKESLTFVGPRFTFRSHEKHPDGFEPIPEKQQIPF